AVPVPVELVTFEAKVMEEIDVIRLTWETASELDNKGFEVQRSLDADSWEVLGFVEGAGTTLKVQRYKYDDSKPGPAYNYYRLKQIDHDGDYEYSVVVQERLPLDKGLRLIIAPNPVRDVLAYQLVSATGTFEENYEIIVFDALGMPVKSEQVATQDIGRLSVEDLPNGAYFVVVKNEREVLIKQNILIVH
ncbi:MAG: T9SS type A sorting domain-containing protein, partial [Bacteroidota bacterium]